jgi:hypothetical protein
VQAATQHVVTRNEQVVRGWLARSTRQRLTIEGAWPSREEPFGRVAEVYWHRSATTGVCNSTQLVGFRCNGAAPKFAAPWSG